MVWKEYQLKVECSKENMKNNIMDINDDDDKEQYGAYDHTPTPIKKSYLHERTPRKFE